jgi:biotin synthase
MISALNREAILHWLKETDEGQLEALWCTVDQVRQEHVGQAVHLRGLIEISNHCVCSCGYCGLRAGNALLPRYRMSRDAIFQSALEAADLGYGTVVLQAGYDPLLTTDWVSDVIRRIKRHTNLAVTLSLGERPSDQLLAWRQAGADRYLLRFETSDRQLYDLIHPPFGRRRSDRTAVLRSLRLMGYEIGGGIMVGIPGQTWNSVADDILLFKALDLDMIGVGPYIAHPQTPLGRGEWVRSIPESEQVPADELMVYKVLALARLVRPDANIPATTALATINPLNGRELGLQRGANVVMPNLTPLRYRQMYEIYPGKACVSETGQKCDACLKARLASIGRTVGDGPGSRCREPAMAF